MAQMSARQLQEMSLEHERQPKGIELEELVVDMQEEMRRRELAIGTFKAYGWAWRHFVAYCHSRSVFRTDDLTRFVLEGWQNGLTVKPRAKACASTAVRRLMIFAAQRGFIEFRLTLAVYPVKQPRRLPRPVPAGDFDIVAEYLDRPEGRASLIGLRDRALFWFLVSTSARVSEALQVKVRDAARLKSFDLAEGAYVIQKGGGERLLIAPPSVLAMLNEYVAARRDNCPYLWVSHTNNMPMPVERLSRSSVREIWRRCARRLRIPYFTTHQLRHVAATALLAAGVPESAAAEHLGHADLRTLMGYAQVNRRARQGAVDAMEQLTKRQRRPAPQPRRPWGRALPVITVQPAPLLLPPAPSPPARPERQPAPLVEDVDWSTAASGL